MNTLTRLVEHADPDVVALALSACQSLPDVTGLLVLADRLQELDDPRERFARRLARLVNVEPREVFGSRYQSVKAAVEMMPADAAVLAAWLACRWASRDSDTIRPVVQFAALVALGLHRPGRTVDIWRQIDPLEDGTGRSSHDLWIAAVDLLDSPKIDEFEDLVCTRAANVCRRAVAAIVGANARPLRVATAAAWRKIGGCIDLVNGYLRNRAVARAGTGPCEP